MSDPAPRLSRELRTLQCFVRSLVGQCVTVELKNDEQLCGDLETVDGDMNCTLSNVSVGHLLKDASRVQHQDTMYVKGKMIRYVFVPDAIHARRHLAQHLRVKRTREERTRRTRRVAPHRSVGAVSKSESGAASG
jgi:small nuclear ribonucleoprotein (snRNP)-like protein